MPQDKSKKTIGILGGMGPQATIDLYQKIVDSTPANVDQDHIHVVIDSNPQIPDRTGYLLGKNENPIAAMLEGLKTLEKANVDFVLIPCNTAHVFVPYLQEQ